MRMLFGLVLLSGIALAGFAVYMANGYVNSYRVALANAKSSESIPTVAVYVASKRLDYGDKLAADAIRLVDFPRASVPDGTFLSEGGTTPYFKPWEDLDEQARDSLVETARKENFDPEETGLKVELSANLFPDSGEERYVLRTIEKGEAILAAKVTDPGQDAGITSRLGRGMRAFALRVDVASGVSGFLRPNDRVDVYWTGRVAQGTGDINRAATDVTKLIETGVKLIAIDQQVYGDKNAATIARTVTVSARPEQVAALAQAQSTGRLSLSLVGSGDTSEIGPVEVDQMRLLGLTAPKPEVVATVERERICTIRTRKGADLQETVIPCTN